MRGVDIGTQFAGSKLHAGGCLAMNDGILFDKTMQVTAQALNLRSRKHDLIVSNLANADTPGYKAFDLLVEQSLQKQAGAANQLALEVTHAGHLQGSAGASPNPEPKIIRTPEPDNLRGDGNTVDMDREMSNLAANQLLYRASAQIMAKKFQMLRNVITGGR
jgi:flagellar basal-body rod protein FlgB